MDRLEDWANWANDQDMQWWPFGFLRPEPHERMGSRRVLALAVLYGVFAGLAMNLVARLAGGGDGPAPWVFPVAGTLGFFLLFRTTFAWSWNRRAARLVTRGGR
jgi:Kef-type K+ transport system membrane component KefB